MGMPEMTSRKINLNTRWMMIVLMSVPALLNANAYYTQKQVISYAKAIDVAKLDPSLSSQPLDEWLRSGQAHIETAIWEVGGCDLKNPPNPAPLCVQIRLKRGNAGGWLIVKVGAYREGIKGLPRLEQIFIGASEGFAPDSDRLDKLSDLPLLLDHTPATTGGR
jgi:hypothetical protein